MRIKPANDIVELAVERLADKLELFRILTRVVVLAARTIIIDAIGRAVDVARNAVLQIGVAEDIADFGIGSNVDRRDVGQDDIAASVLGRPIGFDLVGAACVLRSQI